MLWAEASVIPLEPAPAIVLLQLELAASCVIAHSTPASATARACAPDSRFFEIHGSWPLNASSAMASDISTATMMRAVGRITPRSPRRIIMVFMSAVPDPRLIGHGHDHGAGLAAGHLLGRHREADDDGRDVHVARRRIADDRVAGRVEVLEGHGLDASDDRRAAG